jgi:hypothetical protein
MVDTPEDKPTPATEITGAVIIPGEALAEPVKVQIIAAPDDSAFMTSNLWFGWKRWTWVKIAFAFVVFMGAYANWQIQDNVDDTNDLVAEVEENERLDDIRALENAERAALISREGCQTRNQFQENTRQKFTLLLNAVQVVVVGTNTNPDEIAEIQAAVDLLRAAVDTDPLQEDRDCDGDGELTLDDYLPANSTPSPEQPGG